MEVVTYKGREVRYAATPVDWERVARLIRADGVCGFDSEFWGVDLRTTSPARTAVLDLWSLAVGNGRRHPRGYVLADCVVLPPDAAHHPSIRDVLEDPAIEKDSHNARAEYHTFDNLGVRVDGLLDTLDLARWMLPERVTLGGYGLKDLARDCLALEPVGDFKTLFSVPKYVDVQRKRKVKTCSCGADGCRLRKGHVKTETIETWTERVERGVELLHLPDIRAGHSHWDLYRVYAGEDAGMAFSLRDYLRRVGSRRKVPMPWTPRSAT